MNYNEVKKYICEMAKKTTRGGKKEDTCQYRGDDRYCRMTTNTSCKKCEFYSPTIQATFTAAYNEVLLAKRAYDTNVALAKKMKKSFAVMAKRLEAAEKMSEEAQENYQKLYIAESSMVALWQDSVNSYE